VLPSTLLAKPIPLPALDRLEQMGYDLPEIRWVLHSGAHDGSHRCSGAMACRRETASSGETATAVIAGLPGPAPLTLGGECHATQYQHEARHRGWLPRAPTPYWHGGRARTGVARRR
jgi:hypothetical protein